MKETIIYNAMSQDDETIITRTSIIKAYGHTLRLTINILWIDACPNGKRPTDRHGYSQLENLADDGWHIILTSHDPTMYVGLQTYKGPVWEETEDGDTLGYTEKFITRQEDIAYRYKHYINLLYGPED